MGIAVGGHGVIRGFTVLAAVLAATAGPAGNQASAAVDGSTEPALADLSLEDLGNIEVTSVSKRPERLLDAPASIYVISSEDIRRSGYTSLGDALRLAPNLQVARQGSAQYAISARGFNNAIGNKLLVLIDGRTVYTPLFSGVFWDQQDVLLEDVDRIEVISGPGATLWGANAVNGVINVITKPARDTQGTYLSLRGGNLEQGAAARYGTALSNEGHFRVYAKADKLENTEFESGAPVFDGWEHQQGGFRADWGGGPDRFTLQADGYSSDGEDRGSIVGLQLGQVRVSGANILGRWSRQLEGGSDIQVQAYWDHSERDDIVLYRPNADIYDISFQHSIPLQGNRVLWGGGHRYARDQIDPGLFTSFIPAGRELRWDNLFVQDEIRLGESVQATLGIKVERNDYTGVEYLPSARLAWKPTEANLVWASASRAVRAPSRLDREVFFPQVPPFIVAGGPDFVSEVANVYELGYRAQASRQVTYSLTAFYHDWDRLRSGTAVIPINLVNDIEGHAYGVEAWGTYQATAGWRLSAGATSLRKTLRFYPGGSDSAGVDNPTLSNDPEYSWQLRSSHDLPRGVALDVMVRHVAELPHPEVPAYTAVDLRLGWQVNKTTELALAAQNLFDQEHPEFGDPASRSMYSRGAYASVSWRL